MRHLIVNRVVLALCVWFVGCAALFTWLVRPRGAVARSATAPPPAQMAGEVLFQRHCASCHEPGSMRRALEGRASTSRDRLVTFLAGHGDASDPDDRLIVDYLMAAEPPP